MNATHAALDLAARWETALPYAQFVAEARANRDLWAGVYRLAEVPPWALAWGRERRAPVHLLAIAEDWCGDAVNALPVLAKLAAALRCVELRVLRRDEHPDLMDRYLTDGTRSIPIVIALDADFTPLGAWGPRPSPLQAWVRAHRDRLSNEERYREVRRWYAQDRGETTLREVLALIP